MGWICTTDLPAEKCVYYFSAPVRPRYFGPDWEDDSSGTGCGQDSCGCRQDPLAGSGATYQWDSLTWEANPQLLENICIPRISYE